VKITSRTKLNADIVLRFDVNDLIKPLPRLVQKGPPLSSS